MSVDRVIEIKFEAEQLQKRIEDALKAAWELGSTKPNEEIQERDRLIRELTQDVLR